MLFHVSPLAFNSLIKTSLITELILPLRLISPIISMGNLMATRAVFSCLNGLPLFFKLNPFSIRIVDILYVSHVNSQVFCAFSNVLLNHNLFTYSNFCYILSIKLNKLLDVKIIGFVFFNLFNYVFHINPLFRSLFIV